MIFSNFSGVRVVEVIPSTPLINTLFSFLNVSLLTVSLALHLPFFWFNDLATSTGYCDVSLAQLTSMRWVNCSWKQYGKLPAQEILPGSGADLHLGSYFTYWGHSGCVSYQDLWEQGVQQEQGSWQGKACSCCPEVLLKTVQDCWSQHNGGSGIQQRSADWGTITSATSEV